MNIQTDIAKIASELERRNDEELIKMIYSILNLDESVWEEEVDEATRKRLVDKALRAEHDIANGRYSSIEEVRSRFGKKYGT